MSVVDEDEMTIGRTSKTKFLQNLFPNLVPTVGVRVGWINEVKCMWLVAIIARSSDVGGFSDKERGT